MGVDPDPGPGDEEGFEPGQEPGEPPGGDSADPRGQPASDPERDELQAASGHESGPGHDTGPEAGGGHEPDGGGEHGHHGHAIGTAIGLNVLINAVLNAVSGYGIAWLHWKDYELSWYIHELHDVFESDFVIEDLIVQGASTAIIVALIVAAIVHRQWDAGHLQPAQIDRFLLTEERSRGRHMLVWALGTAVAGGLFAGVLGALMAGGENVSGSTFALARTLNGLVVGGAVGGLITASWVTNLSAGKLRAPDTGRTVVARTMVRSSRHAPIVVLAVLAVTAGLALGLSEIDADLGSQEWTPRGDEHAMAARNASDRFNTTHEHGVWVQFRTDPSGCREDNERNLGLRSSEDVDCGNITDEVYVRAMEEFATFVESHSYEAQASELFNDSTQRVSSPFQAHLGLPTYVKMANWSLAGGYDEAPEAAFSLPPADDRPRVNAAEEVSWETLGRPQAGTMDAGGQQATMLLTIEENATLSSQQIGRFALDARDGYLAWAPDNARWDVFTGGNEPTLTVDHSMANAHEAELIEDDIDALAAVLAGVLVLGLLFALREVKSVLVASGSIAIAAVWTFGTAGHLSVPATGFHLLIAALLASLGAIATIHVLGSYLAHRRAGRGMEAALQAAGDDAAFPIYLAAFVTIVALGTVGLGPTEVLADGSWLALLAVASIGVLMVSFLPAAIRLSGERWELVGDYSASQTIGAIGQRVRGVRGLVAVVLVALTIASLAGVNASDAAGIPGATMVWPEDDELRNEHVDSLQGQLDTGAAEGYAANAIVVEGDLTDPKTIAYLDALSRALEAEAERGDTLAMGPTPGLADTLEDWRRVCCGPSTIAQDALHDELAGLGYESEEFDRSAKTRGDIQRAIEQMFDSPFRRMAQPVVAYPSVDTTVQPFYLVSEEADAGPATVDEQWDTITRVLASLEASQPEDVRTHVAGETTTSHLVAEEQVPWVVYAAIGAVVFATLLAFGYTRSGWATLAMGSTVGLATLWLFGVLELLEVDLGVAILPGLAIALFAAMAYGARVAWNLHRGEPVKRVHEMAGEASLASTLVAAGVLAVLRPIEALSLEGLSNLLADEALLIALAAIGVAHTANLLVAGLLPGGTRAEESTQAEASEGEGAVDPAGP